MFYNLGKVHQISSMASKSCNAVGKRDLYVPLSAEYEVIGRTYKITVTLGCYFATRININNRFTNILLAGETVEDKTVDGWVSQDEPGRAVASLEISGVFNADGTPDRRAYHITASGNMVYYSDVNCQTLKSIPFSNEVDVELSDIEPSYTSPATPLISLSSATDSRLNLHLETTSFGEGGGKFLYAEVSKTNFGTVLQTSNIINELRGDVVVANLQRNTRYYIKAVAANNGMSASATPIVGATLAASEIQAIKPSPSGEIVEVVVYNGGGYYAPTTEIEVSTDLINWETKYTSQETAFFNAEIIGLSAGETYYFRTKTSTDAGIFYSDYVSHTAHGDLWGLINNIDIENDSATVHWTATANGGGEIEAVFYYRVVGLEEEWVECHRATGNGGVFVIDGLNQNYYEYEISADFKKGMMEYNIESVKFHTIPSVVENNTCDSLTYLVQLICQELRSIQKGNIVVYMNNDTKKWCEEENDGTPTLASMMSRVNRFMHAVGCALCSMDGFIEMMKDSKPNQIFMGKLGWVDIDEEVTENSLNPVMSDAIYRAIEELVHKVWHYVRDYDFFGKDLADLRSQTGTNGATGIVGDKVYTWSSGDWRSPQTIVPDDFGVIHINEGTYSGNGYYWFVDGWNRLDFDDREIIKRIEAIEETSVDFIPSLTSSPYKIAVVDNTLSDAQINVSVPTDVMQDTIIVVVE